MGYNKLIYLKSKPTQTPEQHQNDQASSARGKSSPYNCEECLFHTEKQALLKTHINLKHASKLKSIGNRAKVEITN